MLRPSTYDDEINVLDYNVAVRQRTSTYVNVRWTGFNSFNTFNYSCSLMYHLRRMRIKKTFYLEFCSIPTIFNYHSFFLDLLENWLHLR